VEYTPLHLLGAGRLVRINVVPESPHPRTPSGRISALHRHPHDLFVAVQMEVAESLFVTVGAFVGLFSQLLQTGSAVDGLAALHLVGLTCRVAADEADETLWHHLCKLQVIATNLGLGARRHVGHIWVYL